MISWAISDLINIFHMISWAVSDLLNIFYMISWAISDLLNIFYMLSWAISDLLNTFYMLSWAVSDLTFSLVIQVPTPHGVRQSCIICDVDNFTIVPRGYNYPARGSVKRLNVVLELQPHIWPVLCHWLAWLTSGVSHRTCSMSLVSLALLLVTTPVCYMSLTG